MENTVNEIFDKLYPNLYLSEGNYPDGFNIWAHIYTRSSRYENRAGSNIIMSNLINPVITGKDIKDIFNKVDNFHTSKINKILKDLDRESELGNQEDHFFCSYCGKAHSDSNYKGYIFNALLCNNCYDGNTKLAEDFAKSQKPGYYD